MKLRAGISMSVMPGFRETLLRREALKLAFPVPGPAGEAMPGNGRRSLSTGEEDLLLKCAGVDGVSMRLLELPTHLMKQWQDLGADISGRITPASAMDEKAYRDFVQSVLGFLRFKQVRLSDECRCDAMMIPSRGSALALSPRTAPLGTVPLDRAQAGCIAINVGEENATVVFCNLTRNEMAQGVSGCANGESLARIFSQQHPDYGLVCIELEPRQGVLITGEDQMCADYFAGTSIPGAVLLLRGA